MLPLPWPCPVSFSSFLSPFNQDPYFLLFFLHSPPLLPSCLHLAWLHLCPSPLLISYPWKSLDPPFALLPSRSHIPYKTHVQILNLTLHLILHFPLCCPSSSLTRALHLKPPSHSLFSPAVPYYYLYSWISPMRSHWFEGSPSLSTSLCGVSPTQARILLFPASLK